MKKTLSIRLCCVFLLLVTVAAQAQVNSGSNGSDGAFNPTTNTVINMADHPDGIYHYTSVNISNGITVTFIPNANNLPVVWLVQSNCVLAGTVSLDGSSSIGAFGGNGGPGGFKGGNGRLCGGCFLNAGQGPGGGKVTETNGSPGGNGSFGSRGDRFLGTSLRPYVQHAPGDTYGNLYLLPLVGGSGGGGGDWNVNGGGGGGGGAILIAASESIEMTGVVSAIGGKGYGSIPSWPWLDGRSGGGGSGGAIRLVSKRITGNGYISASGGIATYDFSDGYRVNYGGLGRIRLDALENLFNGGENGTASRGFQPVIIPSAGQLPQLTVTSIGGVPVSASPTGALSTPDAVLSAQQNNPIPIVVRCSNLPLNTQITVSVKPANAPAVSATGFNNTGTLASSTATVSINMPRGGGLIYATAAIGN